jgi:Calx-beta domain
MKPATAIMISLEILLGVSLLLAAPVGPIKAKSLSVTPGRVESRNARRRNFLTSTSTTIHLSASSYNVAETDGAISVVVNRDGDTSGTSSVNYATSDTAGLTACAVVNNRASERCDYETSVGTLRFAAGETTKSFTIPIINDALVEGNESFTVSLTGATGATLDLPSSATVTITDNGTFPPGQNPIDTVQFFVTQQYFDFLGRLPDAGGLANWVATLNGCPNGGFGENDHPECDRIHVTAGFFLSPEFQGRGYWAYKFYEVGLDRRPNYAEFVPDMAQVGGPQSPESEILSKAAYTQAFVERPEFDSRYASLSNAAYVNALEQNAEVTLTNKDALITAQRDS